MKTRSIVLLSAFTLTLVAVAVVAFTPENSQPQGGYQVGDKVEDFSLKNVDGSQVSLASLGEVKGCILTFTCNHCPWAQAYEKRTIGLDKKYRAKGFPVVAISPNDPKKVPEDSFEKMKKRAEEKDYPFPYLYDETQEVARAFGAKRTPHVYVLEKQGGDFFVRYIGAIDDNPNQPEKVEKRYVENAVDALLKGKKVPTQKTKAIGCTIKWSES